MGGWPVGLQCQPQSHSLSSGLWILNLGLGFGTWIWDLDLGLDLGLTIIMTVSVVVILEYLCFAINSHSDIHNNKEQLFILRNGMLLTEL